MELSRKSLGFGNIWIDVVVAENICAEIIVTDVADFAVAFWAFFLIVMFLGVFNLF